MNPFQSTSEFDGRIFKRITLESGLLSDKTFYDCSFIDCTLAETTFQECAFDDCLFKNCDLSLIAVEGCSFNNTRFEKTKIIGVDWTFATWPAFVLQPPLSFLDCALDYSTYTGLKLPKVSFKDCSLKDVAFAEADLSGADFSGALLAKSIFHKTNLQGANFTGAKDYHIDLTQNDAAGAKFSLPEAMSLLYALNIEITE
jgi:fluoroquinolone resistance protein